MGLVWGGEFAVEARGWGIVDICGVDEIGHGSRKSHGRGEG